MPRQSRIDAPCALHHVIARGIERSKIFRESSDYEDFIRRLGQLLVQTETKCYAWALIPNHFHLLLKTGNVPIARKRQGSRLNFIQCQALRRDPLSVPYVHGPGIDKPLSIQRKGEVYYYHADGLGSIVALTDKNQKVVESYEGETNGVKPTQLTI